MLEIPPTKNTDAEDVVWGLQTAETLWKRGERTDALVWLRRAVQAAGEANDDDRAVELARFAAELAEVVARSTDAATRPGGVSEPDDGVDISVSMPPPVTAAAGAPSRPAPFKAAQSMTPEPISLAPDALEAEEAEEEPAEGEGRTASPSVPPAEAVHAGIFDPWADPRLALEAKIPGPQRQPSIVDIEDEEGVVTSVRPTSPSRPELIDFPPPVKLPSIDSDAGDPGRSGFAAGAARPAKPAKPPPPLPPRARAAMTTPGAETKLRSEPAAAVASAVPVVAVEPAIPSLEPKRESLVPKRESLVPKRESLVPKRPSLLPSVAPKRASLLPSATPRRASLVPSATPRRASLVPSPTSGAADAKRLELEGVEAFADLPDDARVTFAAAATIHAAVEGEEVSAFALAYILSGTFDVAATMVDASASRLGEGAVLRSRGTTEENVPIRLICVNEKGVVATWSDSAIEAAFRSIPWVEEDLRAAADRIQTLVGITIGPLGERLDASIREEIVGRLTMRPLAPGEIVVNIGEAVPGLLLVGTGELELVQGDAVVGTVGSGDFLFATEVLGAGDAPATARAGAGGALVLIGDRRIAQELLVTCPPLLEVFAGM